MDEVPHDQHVGVLIDMTAWVTAKVISCFFSVFQFLSYFKIASALVWVEFKDLLYASFVRCIVLFSREGAEDRLYATDISGVGP